MNKVILYGMRHDLPYNPKVGKIIDPVPDVKDADEELLNMIYSKDPVTGLPSGDLAIFLSPNANPEVRSYIESRLLKENADISGAEFSQDIINKFKSEITDDDIAYFSRNHGESNEEFQDRMKLFMYNQRQRNLDAKKNRELNDALKKVKES